MTDAAPEWIREIPESTTLKALKREYILHVLRNLNGNRTQSANRLGISIRALRNWIDRLISAGYRVTPPTHLPEKAYQKLYKSRLTKRQY
jgi:DNA-binding NtrC family response regulator